MDYDLIVIGGGAGGLTATRAAVKLGARVLLVEKRALGGDCLFTGCVPSKTLIRIAQVAHEQRTADRFGLPAHAPGVAIDARQVMARVRAAIARIAEHDSPARFEELGAQVRIGAPAFVSRDAVELDGKTLTARAFVLATGSRPALPPIEGLAEAAPLTNETLFSIDALPASLAVIGGGPIGLELGQALHRLGVRVTIVEAAERVLPDEDAECSAELSARLKDEGLAIHTATTIRRARVEGGQKILDCERDGAHFEIAAAELLVAAGRAANVEALGLERAGVELDARRVAVDDELRTTNRRVFAVGDVNGHFAFTHMAGYQAAIAVRNALLPLASRVDYRVVPRATFTAPEVARVGVTEAEARAAETGVQVYRARFADVDRAITDGDDAGFAKLISARGRLVGAHVVGARAGELIHPAVLAMKQRLDVSALASMSWVYPTLSEALRKASQSRYQQLLDGRWTRRAVGVLRLLKGS